LRVFAGSGASIECPVCGMNYGMSHNGSGVAPILSAEEAASVPEGIAPIYYLRLAFNMARWDDVAIRRAARDPQALLYGVVVSMISAATIFLVTALPGMLTGEGATARTIFRGLLLGLVFVWVYMGAIAFFQVGLCHLIARWFLGATGTFFHAPTIAGLVCEWPDLDAGCRRAGGGHCLDSRPHDGLR
jgi:hypothetical protein